MTAPTHTNTVDGTSFAESERLGRVESRSPDLRAERVESRSPDLRAEHIRACTWYEEHWLASRCLRTWYSVMKLLVVSIGTAMPTCA